MNVLDIVSIDGVIDVRDVLRFGFGVGEGGDCGDGTGGESGSRSAGGMGDGEFSRLT